MYTYINNNYHRITEAPDCPCGNGNQTAEHTLLECGILREERERLIAAVAKTDNWQIKKICLSKYTRNFRRIQENGGQNKRT